MKNGSMSVRFLVYPPEVLVSNSLCHCEKPAAIEQLATKAQQPKLLRKNKSTRTKVRARPFKARSLWL